MRRGASAGAAAGSIARESDASASRVQPAVVQRAIDAEQRRQLAAEGHLLDAGRNG